MAKLDFRRILVVFFPFSKTSVFPYTVISSVELQEFQSFPLF